MFVLLSDQLNVGWIDWQHYNKFGIDFVKKSIPHSTKKKKIVKKYYAKLTDPLLASAHLIVFPLSMSYSS